MKMFKYFCSEAFFVLMHVKSKKKEENPKKHFCVEGESYNIGCSVYVRLKSKNMNTNIEKVYLIIITQWFSCFGYLDKLPVYECFVIEWQGGIRKRATTTKKKKC